MIGRFLRSIGASLAALLWIAPPLATPVGCVASPTPENASPRVCARDLDCGEHHYCSDALVCQTDCYVDADCLGPTSTAQCNAHGRCIETDLDALPPDAPGDVASDDSEVGP